MEGADRWGTQGARISVTAVKPLGSGGADCIVHFLKKIEKRRSVLS